MYWVCVLISWVAVFWVCFDRLGGDVLGVCTGELGLAIWVCGGELGGCGDVGVYWVFLLKDWMAVHCLTENI